MDGRLVSVTRCTMSLFFADDDPLLLRDGRRNGLADELMHGMEARWADLVAGPAFYTFVLVDDVDKVLIPGDGVHGASTAADPAGLALFRIDPVRGDLF